MIKFLLWCILLVLCWPLALVALVLYPLVWLLLLPFRLLGIVVEGALEFVRALILLPARVLRGPGRVWLQTLPFSRLAGRMMAAAGGRKEQGGLLGNLLQGDN